MALKTQLQALTTKEMDRKEFLKYSGSVLLAVIGVTGFLRILLGSHNAPSEKKQTNGYGASVYGR